MALRLPEVITQEELHKLVQATKKPHHRLAFMLGFFECMRVSEVVNLKPENVDKQLKLLRIVQGKGGKDAVIPIAPEVMKMLKHLPVGCKVRALQIKFKENAKKVLGKDLHFHCLRHSGITYYIVAKRWSTLEVQRLARHSKVATTQIYTHIRPEDLVARMWS